MDFDWSKLMSSGVGAAGSFLGGQQQAAQSAQQIQNNRDTSRASLLSSALSGQQANQLSRDQTGLQASDPTKLQNWRQQQAVIAALMPGIRNSSVQIPSNLAGYASQNTGGIRIPEGGFDQSTLSFFSPESRMAAEEQYWKAASPFTAPADLSASGYGAAADATDERLNTNYQNVKTEQQSKNQQQLNTINQLLSGEAAGGSSAGSSILGAILSALASGLKFGPSSGSNGASTGNSNSQDVTGNDANWDPALGTWVGGSGTNVTGDDANWDPGLGTWVYPSAGGGGGNNAATNASYNTNPYFTGWSNIFKA